MGKGCLFLVYILCEWPVFKRDSSYSVGGRYMLGNFMSLLPSADFFSR